MSQKDIDSRQIAELKNLVEQGSLSQVVSKKVRAIVQFYESDSTLDEVAVSAGVSGSALRRWLDQFDPTDLRSLEEKSRKPLHLRSSRIDARTVALIKEYRMTAHRMGKEEIAVQLKADHNIESSASAIGRIIERDCLYFGDCPLHRRKRYQAERQIVQKTQSIDLATQTEVMTVDAPRKHPWSILRQWTIHALFVTLLVVGTILGVMITTVTRAHAASVGAELLVNTEAFYTIDEGDGLSTTNIELTFGSTVNEKLYWNRTLSRFDITDDFHVDADLSSSGSLAVEANATMNGDITLNSDRDSNNAVLTFGNITQNQTLSFIHSTQKFKFSTSVDIVGTMSGYALTVSGLRNCNTVDTDANGVFSCGTDEGGAGSGISQSDGDARYVNVSGDTMTGALDIRTSLSLPVNSGALNVHQLSDGTGAIIRSVSGVAPALALSINGSSASPHLLFGYAGTFDTNLYRSVTNTLKTDGNLRAVGSISGAQLRANNMTVSGAIVYSSGNTLMQNAKGLSGQLLISQATSAPKWATPVGGMMWYLDSTQAVAVSKGPQITMPFAITLSDISLKAKGAPTGADLIYDINKDGTTIFSTRPQINAGSTTGGGSAVFSTTLIEANTVLTLDIDQVGSTFAGSGVTIMLKGTRRY